MKKIFFLVLLFWFYSVLGQPIPHFGWPVTVYPFGFNYNFASCIVNYSESLDAEIILKGGNRIVSFSLSGQFLHNYSSIQTEGLRGWLTKLSRANTNQIQVATITQPYTITGGNLIVGDSNGVDLMNRNCRRKLSINNPYSFDIDNDGNDELFVLFDTLYCFDRNFNVVQNFSMTFNHDSATGFSGLAFVRMSNWNNPLICYHLRDSLYLQEIGSHQNLNGFPVYLPSYQYQSAPVFFQHTSGLYIYAHHQSNQSGRLKCINQNGQIVFDYGVGGMAQSSLCITLLDIEGDSLPEVIVTYNSRIPMVYTWNGATVVLQDTLSNQYNGKFSSVVGYRPPNQQTLWFYALGISDTALYLMGRQGINPLPGFPVRVPLTTRVSLQPTLNLIPPYNDTLRIIIGNSIDFMMYDYPCPSGGVMECETARFDYNRTGLYQPRTIPYSWIRRPFKGELPKNHRIKVFPNPTNSQFITIIFQKDTPHQLMLYNSLGQKIQSITTSNLSFVTMDVHHLPSGNYYLTDNHSSTIPVSIVK